MAFQKSSCNIRLNGTVLVATCSRSNGSTTQSQIDLNSYVANIDGKLVWQNGGNFAQSSQNIEVSPDGSVLKCISTSFSGQKVPAQLILSEHIANMEGNLEVTL